MRVSDSIGHEQRRLRPLRAVERIIQAVAYGRTHIANVNHAMALDERELDAHGSHG